MVKKLDGDWIPLRRGIKEHIAKMGVHAFVVFIIYLLSVDYKTWVTYIGTRKIAKIAGLSQRTVLKARRELIKAGYIKEYDRYGIWIPKFMKYIKKVMHPVQRIKKKTLNKEYIGGKHLNEKFKKHSRKDSTAKTRRPDKYASIVHGAGE